MSSFFGTIKTLGLSKDDSVKSLLYMAVSLVEPIMRKRNWFVDTLQEFYPRSKSLEGLNENSGEVIKVRCRCPKNKRIIYPLFEVCGTLLHELVHIEIGPHNRAFHKLLNELWQEFDEIQISMTRTYCQPKPTFVNFGVTKKRIEPPRKVETKARPKKMRTIDTHLNFQSRVIRSSDQGDQKISRSNDQSDPERSRSKDQSDPERSRSKDQSDPERSRSSYHSDHSDPNDPKRSRSSDHSDQSGPVEAVHIIFDVKTTAGLNLKQLGPREAARMATLKRLGIGSL
jgi:hypothetical protein